MEYLREKIDYHIANELMSFSANPDKKFDHSNKEDRINIIRLMQFKVNLIMDVLPNSYKSV